MNRKRRCQILIDGNEAVIDTICREIELFSNIHIVNKPNKGVVMVQMKDAAKNGPFYIGEVLVTEAKVEVDDFIGIGLIKGHDLDKSYKLALVDAVYNGNNSNIPRWNELLLEEEAILLINRSIEDGRILKTKVDFNTMVDQGVSSKC